MFFFQYWFLHNLSFHNVCDLKNTRKVFDACILNIPCQSRRYMYNSMISLTFTFWQHFICLHLSIVVTPTLSLGLCLCGLGAQKALHSGVYSSQKIFSLFWNENATQSNVFEHNDFLKSFLDSFLFFTEINNSSWLCMCCSFLVYIPSKFCGSFPTENPVCCSEPPCYCCQFVIFWENYMQD